MSDSIDRVFVHALNTVKKIPRTGTARPPSAERLKLYGLYKQSMGTIEGDVEGIMDQPVGDGTDAQAEREKWDAWHSQRGLSRTEAKRRYITTLIDTMHRYASQTPEARELVSELEFVWDQIKSNASSSSSSSPLQASHQHFSRRPGYSDDGIPAETRRQLRLTHLNPISYPDHEIQKQEEEDEDEEEYHEAVDLLGDGINSNDHNLTVPPRDGRIDLTGTPGDINQNRKWRRRVEQALTKMTAEIAAVREQIESRSSYSQRRSSLLVWLKWLFWAVMRQVIWNMAILGLVLVWMRLKGDRRLEKMLKAGLVDLIDRLSKLRLLRRLPLLPLLL